MATLDSQDANILDAEVVNWRWVVYPIVGVLVVVLGGLGIYYFEQSQRETHEAQARQALLQAKTPAALMQVADQFPGTSHAAFALLSAANLSFEAKAYDTALTTYQRVANGVGTDAMLKDSARVGLAATFEAQNNLDEAINTYLAVAHRGSKSPYAAFAYLSAAVLYDEKNDKEDERRILTEATGLDPDSDFVKAAKEKLKALNAAAQPDTAVPPTSGAVPTPTSPASTSAAPTGTNAPAPAP
jgi:predicted negative regulator of RcsB-dependent stress response